MAVSVLLPMETGGKGPECQVVHVAALGCGDNYQRIAGSR